MNLIDYEEKQRLKISMGYILNNIWYSAVMRNNNKEND